ncbi:Flp family type IVb pilin [Ralstonia solanacearum]|uniref:Flp family type IVb pilin n=1 Tax=Ralstonia solanacearum K60 TaxID=1091042 RepID=A0AAP8D3K6_RALSL|nr:Flp family type IVb pilin [Ralstonia solanacearum]MBT1537350.1 Flp family type IVb pilin [Ralstonia solanacearum]OKA44045.1 pili assembly chaperone [Ralstonia solanacearum]OYQ12696.1 Flp family type IVb pilin [Ralstonia solanacearum K60]RIJ87623.1 Flp family type IVb pilin [Ralstonia solanacearum]CCF96975.1 putative pilin transmembrane protein [Ralstonia solanacearum K60]
MKAMIERFVREEDGAAGVEYALLLAFVALVMVTYGTTVKTAVGAIWNSVATQLSTAAG